MIRSRRRARPAATIRGACGGWPLHEDPAREELEINSAATAIGAGPAGLTAALTLAEADRRVLLVEKESAARAGWPAPFEELFPNLECGTCLLEPLLGEVLHGRHAGNIESAPPWRRWRRSAVFWVIPVKAPGSGRVLLDLDRCIGCGECIVGLPGPRVRPAPHGGGPQGHRSLPFPAPCPGRAPARARAPPAFR
ncbi:MAG: FAD-binding protein [Desulfurivibrio sp.]|nr:FAD-binding protein [Desulfurivibrio sp.]